MSKRTVAPFRNDHVGSFLRTPEIKKARVNFDNGLISKEELARIEDHEITKLVSKQKEVGLLGITDGEFRRSYWHLDFFWGLNGVEHTTVDHGFLFTGKKTRQDSAKASGKISFDKNSHPFIKHYKFLKSVVGDSDGAIARQTIPSPAQLFTELFRPGNGEALEKHYPNKTELFNDISKAYNDAILAFYEEGCRNIQLDDTTWSMICDEKFAFRIDLAGASTREELLEMYLKLNNDALNNLPADLIVTTHTCRGNFSSTYAADGAYDPVAEVFFAKSKYNGFYLEYETNRAGTFQPLRSVSNGAVVVLGVVSSKFGKLENKADIIARIHEAAKYIPLENLCISPQCGFASTEEGNVLTEEEQWAKLAFVKEIADEVWS